MSLENIGKYTSVIKDFKGVTDVSDNKFDALVEVIKNVSDTSELNNIFKAGNVPKNVAEAALEKAGFKDSANAAESVGDIAEAAGDLGKATGTIGDTAEAIGDVAEAAGDGAEAVIDMAKATEGLSESAAVAGASTGRLWNIIVGLVDSVKGFVAMYAPLLGIGAALGAILFAANKYHNAFGDAANKTQELSETYSGTKSEIESLNVELENTQSRIDELESQGTLSITEEAELSKLKAQNDELERQIKLKEQLMTTQQAEAEKQALETLSLKTVDDYSTGVKQYNVGSGKFDYVYRDTDILTASRNEVESLREAKAEREKLVKEYNKTGDKAINTQIESLDEKIGNLETGLDEKMENLQNLRNALADATTTEGKRAYREITQIIDGYNNIDLSPLEQNYKALQNFFNGSSESEAVKKYLTEQYNSLNNKRQELIENLENEKQKITDWGLEEYSDDILNQTIQSKFGNVDMDKRKIITWSEEMKKTYKDALASWDYDPEVGGIDTVFGGSSRFGENVLEQGVEVAFTPIMDGKFLDQNTVYDYIEDLVGEATTDGVFSEEKLLSLDKQGKQMGDTFVKGLIAATDEGLDYENNGNWAEVVGRLMHFSGDFGAISLAYKNIDKAAKKAGLTSEEFIKGLSNSNKLQEALASVGLTLEDLGLTGEESVEALNQYFNDLTESINAANEAASNFTPPNVEDVEGAFESANQGANYDSIVEKLKTAKEMAKKGLYGTDDLQTITQWILPYKVDTDSFGSKAFIDAWEKAYTKVNGWFNEDDPANGMWSFLDDLKSQNANLFSEYDKSEGLVEFSKEFKTSAQAAKELGVNVDVVDTMLHKLQEYGFTFDDDFQFTGDLLSEYDSALTDIKDIYDSMAASDYKDELGIDIDKWTKEYNTLSNNLDELTEDQVIEIKFEYNLASLKANISQLQQQWDSSGDITIGAGLISEKTSYREELESKIGYNEKSKDKGYKGSYKTINNLQSQIKNASEEDKVKLQEQISSMLDMQNAFLELRKSGKDINWNDFLNSKQAGKVFDDLIKKGNLSKEEISDLFGIDGEEIDVSIKAKVNADTKKAEKQLKSLEKGGTITYTANVDDVEQEVEAHKDENGIIHYTVETEDGETVNASKITTTNNKGKEKIYYSTEIDSTNVEEKIDELNNGSTIQFTANLDGVDQQIEAYKDEEGTITYTEILTGEQVELDKYGNVTYLKAGQEEPEDKNAKVDYELGKQENPVMKSALVNYKIGSQEDPKTKQAKIKYVKEVTEKTTGSGKSSAPQLKGDGTFYRGTAHFKGSAFSNGNIPSDAFTSSKYRTNKGSMALTGEEDQELVVHGNEWWTVGDNGAEFSYIPPNSIVFDAQQTKELLDTGSINSRGKAYLHGTAYSGGFLPTGSSDTGSNSKPSSTTNSEKTTSNKKSSDDNKKKKSKKTPWDKFEKWVDKFFDWIEIKLDKLSKKTERWTTLAENAVTYAAKESRYKKAISATKTEITANDKASTAYLKQAKTVGKKGAKAAGIKNSTKWVNNILADLQNGKLLDKNGKVKASAIKKYGEKSQTIISDMNEWVQKAIDSKDKVQELKDSFADLYEELENLANNKAAEKIEEIDHQLSLLSTNYDMANSLEARQSNLQAQNQKAKETMDAYNKAYSSTSSSLNSAMNSLKKLGINADGVNGVNAKDSMSVKQAEAVAKYNAALEASKEALKNAQQAQADYNKALYDNAHQMFQNIIDEFEYKREIIAQKSTRINNAMELNETKGYRNSKVYYEGIMANDQKEYTKMKQQLTEAETRLEQNLREKGSDYKGTENYQAEVKAINDIINQMDEMNIQIAETQNNINELDWDNFDKLQEAISRVTDEASFLIDELSRKDLVDSDTGTFTDEGRAVMALYAGNYEANKQQVEMYNKEIADWKKYMKDNGLEDNDEARNHLNDLVDAQREYASACQESKYAMIDMAKDGLNAQKDYLQEIIDKYKDLMDKQQSAYEYQKNLNSAVEEINNVQKQIEVYSGDNSEENRARIQQLNKDLKDKQESLQDMQREKLTSDINNMFDDLMDNYGDYIDDLMSKMDDNFDELISAVNEGLGDTQTIISEFADSLGIDLSEQLRAIQHGNNIEQSTKNSINQIESDQNKLVNDANSKATSDIANIDSESNALDTARNNAVAKGEADRAEQARQQAQQQAQQQALAERKAKEEADKKKKKQDDKNAKDLKTAQNYILNHVTTPPKGTKASSIKDPVKKAIYNSTDGKRYIEEKYSDALAKKLGVKENAPLYNRLKELGVFTWLKKNVTFSNTGVVVKSFAKGSKNISNDMLAQIGEKGHEIVYRSADGSILTPLGKNDMVFTHEMSENLWKLAKQRNITTVPGVERVDKTAGTVNNMRSGDVIIQLNGNIELPNVYDAKEFTEQLKQIIKSDRNVQGLLMDSTVNKALTSNYNSLSVNKW